jgi:hypothetical protein
MSETLYSGTIQAKWHTLFLDVLESDKGVWLQIAETRPDGKRQSVVIEEEHWPGIQSELLKAVSAVSTRADNTHSASAVRARSYAEWPTQEDQALRFLFGSGAGLAAIATAFQRERGAVRSRLRHLDIEVAEF